MQRYPPGDTHARRCFLARAAPFRREDVPLQRAHCIRAAAHFTVDQQLGLIMIALDKR